MAGYPQSPYPQSPRSPYPPPSPTYPPQQSYPHPPPSPTYPPQQSYPYPPPSPTYPQQPSYPYPSPFSAVVPTPVVFPPGTDPNAVACFNVADEDRDGFISDKELQKALSWYGHTFNSRTIHLLLSLYTTKVTRIGPKEFVPLYNSLQSWKAIFQRFDADRSGMIDAAELRNALSSNGYAVSPATLQLLVSKFGRGAGKGKAIEYSYFIECFLTVKGLTDKFKEKDVALCGSVTFTYESFLLTVIPFLTA